MTNLAPATIIPLHQTTNQLPAYVAKVHSLIARAGYSKCSLRLSQLRTLYNLEVPCDVVEVINADISEGFTFYEAMNFNL